MSIIEELTKIENICETFEESKLEALRVYLSNFENKVKSIKYKIRKAQRKNQLLNKEFKTNEGYTVKLLKHISDREVEVLFEDGYKTSVNLTSLVKGEVKNPHHKSIYGIGYKGVGKYKTTINGKHTKYYSVWKSMLSRCYSETSLRNSPSYHNCLVDERWHNFQVFAEWFEENYKEDFALDKDILVKENKIYSPETCCFVPQDINNLFPKSKGIRGVYPIGVLLYSAGKYKATMYKNNCSVHLGIFKTIEEAFECYKLHKEMHIKEMANLWREKITEKVYEAMYSYKVEITD